MAVMAALNGLYSNKQEWLITSISSIGYFLFGKFLDRAIKKDRSIAEKIKTGIQSLEKRKIISVTEQNGDNYVFEKDGLEINTEKATFVVIELWEVQQIFSAAKKPFDVFSFFVKLVGTINNTTKEWHMSQDEMAVQWGCSKRTVNDYLKQLSEMKLIYVYRPHKRRIDGTFHKINNSYGRYADASDGGKLDLSVFENYISDFADPEVSDDQWVDFDSMDEGCIEEIFDIFVP